MNDDNNSSSTSRFGSFFDVNAWWYISATVMLAVVIGVIAIVMLPSNNPGNATPTTTTPTPTAPLSSPATPEASTTATGWDDLGCNATKGDHAAPTLAPEASWEPVGVMSAPRSKTYGPAQVDGFIRSCYQHTPTGAVFAGINYTIAVGTAPQSDRSRVIETAMTPGAARESALSSTPGELGWKITAFHVDSCIPERCNVVYIVSAQGALGQLNTALVWQDGDWHIDGTQNPGGGPVASTPPGYVTWGA